jgi:hypothetical protein
MGRMKKTQIDELIPDKSSEKTRAYFRKELAVDIVEVYEKLKDISTIPANKLRDRDVLSAAINEAALNSHRANMIYLRTRAMREEYKATYATENRELSRQATIQIQEWMEVEEVKKKQITINMVFEEICSSPALRKRYDKIQAEQEELRAIRDVCKSLVTQWESRKGLLQTQARFITQQREIVMPVNKG